MASSWCCTVASTACSAALSALAPAAWHQGRCALRAAASCHSSSALTIMSAHAMKLSYHSSPSRHTDIQFLKETLGWQPAATFAPTASFAGSSAP